jgi:uncharacterized protein (DUF1684 family)
MSYRDRIRNERAERERFVADHPNSPVPEGFAGLDHYPIDPDYRFEVDLAERDDPPEVVVGTSTDGERTYRRFGEFTVGIDGEAVALSAFVPDGETPDGRLWVPFRDETNGETTYGAGRYLDLTADDRTDDGRWVLDFNRAYNPTCAYNYGDDCPLVPLSNWLEVRIEAGERAYPGDPIGADRGDDHGR